MSTVLITSVFKANRLSLLTSECDRLEFTYGMLPNSATFSQKVGALSLVGNVCLIASLFYQRHKTQMEESEEMASWQAANQRDFSCYASSKRYFDQCRLELDDADSYDCISLAETLQNCRNNLAGLLPSLTPSMRSLPIGFRT